MAVLVEGISVIIRRDAIERAYKSGWKEFLDDVPNAALCADDELARVGFMDPDSVKLFVDRLCARGITFVSDDKCIDIAVVDQLAGPTLPCDWLEFAQLDYDGNGGQVSACWLFEDSRIGAGIHMTGTSLQVATPEGWDFENSLSAKHTFVPNEAVEGRLEYLRTEDGVDVYRDMETGKEVFKASLPTD